MHLAAQSTLFLGPHYSTVRSPFVLRRAQLPSFPSSDRGHDGRQIEAEVTRAQKSPLSCLLRTQMRLQFPVGGRKIRRGKEM